MGAFLKSGVEILPAIGASLVLEVGGHGKTIAQGFSFARALARKRDFSIIKEMQEAHRQPIEVSTAEIKVLSSSFIGMLFPCKNTAEFEEIYQKVRKEHFKSDHIPYALITAETQKSSDDGEPGGAAGMPLLTLLKAKGIDNALLLVVRYFGGTKLGLPRLRKSFLEAATLAMEKGRFAIPVEVSRLQVVCDYSTFEKARRIAEKQGWGIGEVDYGISVTFVLSGDDTMFEKWESLRIPAQSTCRIGNITILQEVEAHD